MQLAERLGICANVRFPFPDQLVSEALTTVLGPDADPSAFGGDRLVWAVRAGLEIVATGATQSAPGKPNGGTYTATVYPGPRDNFVFNAATCWWADGLSAPPGYVRPKVYTEPKGPDKRIQQITANVLARMRG